MRRIVVLLDDMCVLAGDSRLEVPEGGKRLLAYVSLAGGRADRRQAAGDLWPDGGDVRAAGNLRSALWRLRGGGIDVLEANKGSLWLADGVDVDVARLNGWAQRLIAGAHTQEDLVLSPSWSATMSLLPGWYDDWVIFERERIRQGVLHGLDRLAAVLCRCGRYGEAVDVALTAVAADTLRESAYRVLLEVHLAEGNLREAHRTLELCRETFLRELGVQPSPTMFALLSRARESRGSETTLRPLTATQAG